MFASASPALAGIGGVYLKDNDISELDEDPEPIDFATEQHPRATVVPHAVDPGSARRLWDLSERLLARQAAEVPPAGRGDACAPGGRQCSQRENSRS